MKITFRELYQAVRETKLAANTLGVDIDNSPTEEGRGLLTEEQVRFRNSYMNLYNTDVNINEDITEIRRKVDLCLSYINVH
ncbi:hypothetical protein [Paenibacillus sp. NPDC058177]|uniref:hypothetical protein n=1 Tax=Paenibacillus sp. NPDC058177 TaxID=3346369 RepID=UPI0036DCEC0F